MRTALVAGVIASIGLAIGARELNRLRGEAAAVESLREAGALIHFDHERGEAETWDGVWRTQTPPPNPLGLNALFGEDFFATAVIVRLYSGGEATADHVECLPRLASLERASLYDHRFGDESIEALGRCERLFDLELGRTRTTGEGLSRLANRERIEIFRFEEGNPSGIRDPLARVDCLSNLKRLDVSYTYLTKTHGDAIGRLKKLEAIRFFDLKGIEPGALESFANLDATKTLDFGIHPGCPLSDEDLSAISGMEKLEVLAFDGSGITDEGAKHLGKLRNLRKLSPILRGVTDEGIAALASVATLEELCIECSPITDAGLDALDRLPNLKTIRIGPSVSRERAIEFSRAVPGREVERYIGSLYINRTEVFPADAADYEAPERKEGP